MIQVFPVDGFSFPILLTDSVGFFLFSGGSGEFGKHFFPGLGFDYISILVMIPSDTSGIADIFEGFLWVVFKIYSILLFQYFKCFGILGAEGEVVVFFLGCTVFSFFVIFFKYDMAIGSGHSEGADSCSSWVFFCCPWFQAVIDIHGCIDKVYGPVGSVKM